MIVAGAKKKLTAAVLLLQPAHVPQEVHEHSDMPPSSVRTRSKAAKQGEQ